MRPGMAIGGVALLGVAAAIGFGGFDWVSGTTQHLTDTVTDPVDTVALDTGDGNVTLRTAPVNDITVTRDVSYYGTAPERTYQVDGDTLRLNSCDHWCSVDYTVTVPLDVTVIGNLSSGDANLDGVQTVKVTSQSGNLQVTNVRDADLHATSGDITVNRAGGTVTAETSSGDLGLYDIAGRVGAQSSSGGIVGRGLHGPVQAQSSSGDIGLTVTAGSDISANTSSGDVALSVPRNVPYRVNVDANDNHSVAVPNSPGAQFALTAESSSGDVTVTPA